MKNKVTTIFGTIAGIGTMLSQMGIHFPVHGVDIVSVVTASAIAGVGIAAKDWNVSHVPAQSQVANSASVGR